MDLLTAEPACFRVLRVGCQNPTLPFHLFALACRGALGQEQAQPHQGVRGSFVKHERRDEAPVRVHRERPHICTCCLACGASCSVIVRAQVGSNRLGSPGTNKRGFGPFAAVALLPQTVRTCTEDVDRLRSTLPSW